MSCNLIKLKKYLEIWSRIGTSREIKYVLITAGNFFL